ncbi:MAG: hypothetical protein QME51_09875 [Planctomycetota bacterium]|nr:hypothetical protein [Planctomycetota bacterium]
MNESYYQREIIRMLKTAGYLTMKEVVRMKELGCNLPAHKGIFGRVNSIGVADAKTGHYRRNPDILIGMPDIQGFVCRMKNINPLYKNYKGLYKPFAIEIKSDKGVLSPAQQIYKEWCENSGTIYILAQGEQGLEEVRIKLC